MKPNIFISYSAEENFSQEDNFTIDVRDQIDKKLSDQGFNVFVDKKRIKPGDQWRFELDYWLNACHGAIILLSRKALSSDWVLKETTILTHRRSLQPDFKLIPVLLGDVQLAETGLNHYKPLQLGEIQFIPPLTPELNSETAEYLVEKVVSCFNNFNLDKIDRKLRTWVQDVAACLERANERHFKLAVEYLGFTNEDLANDCYAMMAFRLLHSLCTGSDCTISFSVIQEVSKLMPPDYRKQLFDLIEPCGVKLESVRNILPVTQYDEVKRYLAINAEYNETGKRYLRRATCCSTDFLYIETSGITGEDVFEESMKQYIKALRRKLHIPDSYNDDQIKKTIDGWYAMKKFIFVIIGQYSLNRKLLQELYELCHPATFVLVTGTKFPDPKLLGLSYLECIEPDLKLDEERNLRAHISNIAMALQLDN